MGFLGDLFGSNSDFKADTHGMNYMRDLEQSHDALNANLAGQNNLGSMLLQNAQGQGANPAMEMLKRQTEMNNAQNAGFIASQKGINPALAARLAAQNQGMMNQDAASQGAILQAQQQLAAQSQLGNLYGQVGNQQLQRQGQFMNAAQGTNQINQATAAQNASNNASMFGSVLGAVAPVAGLFKSGASSAGSIGGMAGAGEKDIGNLGNGMMMAAHGGEIPELHSYLDGFLNAKSGGMVPGSPKVMGDSYRNDTVPAKLSPGEMVIPNSVMQSPDPVLNAAKFIAAAMAKKGRLVK